MKDWVEVTWCPYCGYKFTETWKAHPHGLYGNKIQCGGGLCRKEFVVTHAILKDRDSDGGLLERLTHEGHQPRQTELSEFIS